MTAAELRAHMADTYAGRIKAEVDRAVETCPLAEGSDAAHALRALVGNDLVAIAQARLAAEQTAHPNAA